MAIRNAWQPSAKWWEHRSEYAWGDFRRKKKDEKLRGNKIIYQNYSPQVIKVMYPYLFTIWCCCCCHVLYALHSHFIDDFYWLFFPILVDDVATQCVHIFTDIMWWCWCSSSHSQQHAQFMRIFVAYLTCIQVSCRLFIIIVYVMCQRRDFRFFDVDTRQLPNDIHTNAYFLLSSYNMIMLTDKSQLCVRVSFAPSFTPLLLVHLAVQVLQIPHYFQAMPRRM